MKPVRHISLRPAAPTGVSAAASRQPTKRPVPFAKAGMPAPAPTAAAPPKPTTTEGLSSFIELEMEARGCRSLDDLRFAIVNGSRRIAAFEQAFLAERSGDGQWTITRASNVSTVDRHTPYVRGLEAWLNAPEHAEQIGRGDQRLADLRQEATAWRLRTQPFKLPHALWTPIKARDGALVSCLVSLKSENWRPQHTVLMIPLADAYGHAWDALVPRSANPGRMLRSKLGAKRWSLIAALAAACAAFVPVPMSALAPAEIVATEPTLIAAPIDGVISDFHLPPGAHVRRGDVLVTFIDVKLRNDAEVARRNVSVAEAKYFRVMQSAASAQKDLQDIAIAKTELDVATAERRYLEDLLARSQIVAPRDGVLVYTSKSDWVGKPVSTGERLMEIADPLKTEIRVDLPVSDAIAINTGGRVSLFLDGSPLSAITGKVARTSFRPVMTADQQLAFRIHARFDEVEPRRIGLRGVARLSTDDVPLWFYLFRRPIAAIRQRVGL